MGMGGGMVGGRGGMLLLLSRDGGGYVMIVEKWGVGKGVYIPFGFGIDVLGKRYV